MILVYFWFMLHLTIQDKIFLSALPEKFTKQQAIDICIELELSKRFFEVSMRKKSFKDVIKRYSQGVYIKTS